MANREGMPDDAISSLLTPSTGQVAKVSNDRSSRARRSTTKTSILQRMEFPMGERPAATVLKSSPKCKNQHSSAAAGRGNLTRNLSSQQPTLEAAAPDSTSSPLVGAVVERPVKAANRPKSHFASRRDNAAVPLSTTNGFPSVRSRPLGSFVPNNPHRKTNPVAASMQSSATHNQYYQQKTPIKEASQRDAQAMLEQMTTEEIRTAQRQLQQELSPSLVDFLKRRGQTSNRTNSIVANRAKERTDAEEAESTREPSTRPSSSPEMGRNDPEEKERFSALLSSLQSYEDLDAAFAAQTGSDSKEDTLVEIQSYNDWETITRLLRSTSPRQVLWAARMACLRLQEDARSGRDCSVSRDAAWPYPIALPVSLCCLLGVPHTQSHGLLLHTYSLNSLYALLRLRAHADHVIDVTCKTDTATSICQEYFLEDAVRTPRYGTCYHVVSLEPVTSVTEGEAVVYATSSSATSAKQDGEAFARDPMWTLLSRMRILPQIAHLLGISERTAALPDEAVTAICGILSMLCLRSPGAASAIVNHASLIKSLLRTTVMPPLDKDERSNFFQPARTLPALMFLCALSRQSRLAATSLPVNEFLPPLLAFRASTRDDYKVQQQGLILLRTLLRYGVGMTDLKTYIPLSVSHMAVTKPMEYSLAVEYATLFANVLHCVRVAKRKSVEHASQRLCNQDLEVLSSAPLWLAGITRQAVEQCRSIERTRADEVPSVAMLRFATARLRLIHAYLKALEVDGNLKNASHGQKLILSRDDFLQSFEAIVNSGFVEYALHSVPQCTYICDEIEEIDTGCVEGISAKHEAASCAFLESLASCLTLAADTDSEVDETTICCMRGAITRWMQSPQSRSASTATHASRNGWLDKTYFALCRFLLKTRFASNECLVDSSDKSCIRSLAFTLLGRLERGEEAMAAILASDDSLLESTCTTLQTTSSLSSMLIKELCATDAARLQLDHSFKLLHGFGISKDQWGGFEMGTLLSEAQSQAINHPLTALEGLFLPLGKLWIWKILSGLSSTTGADMELASAGEDSLDHVEILEACLSLLVDLETEIKHFKISFAARLPAGAKLYHLLNVCLQPERIHRNEGIGKLVMKLYDYYIDKARVGSGATLFGSFAAACLDHSSKTARGRQPSSTDESSDKLSPQDQKLLSLFKGGAALSSKDFIAVKDFVHDLCTAYMEFGAQYDAFTKCIRLLLCACFPSVIRCEVIHRLRELLPLWTLREEAVDLTGQVMSILLEVSLTGMGQEYVDPPEVLDLLVSVMKKSDDCTAVEKWNIEDGGFFFLFAVASLSRSLVASAVTGSSGMETIRRRLSALPLQMVDLVIEITGGFQSNPVSAFSSKTLVSTVMSVCKDYRTDPTLRHLSDCASLDGENWTTIEKVIRRCGTDG